MMLNKSGTRQKARAKKRRKNAKTAKRQLLVVSTCTIVIIFCVTTLAPQVMGYLKSTQRLSQVEKAYEQAVNEQAALEIELKKAQNPDYIKQYAREKYFLSHEGEILLVLPEPEKKVVEAETPSFWDQMKQLFKQE